MQIEIIGVIFLKTKILFLQNLKSSERKKLSENKKRKSWTVSPHHSPSIPISTAFVLSAIALMWKTQVIE
jgi:hypothetical protein